MFLPKIRRDEYKLVIGGNAQERQGAQFSRFRPFHSQLSNWKSNQLGECVASLGEAEQKSIGTMQRFGQKNRDGPPDQKAVD